MAHPVHSTSRSRSRRSASMAMSLAVILGLLLGLTAPIAASASGREKATVKLRVKVSKTPYSVGERPVVRVKIKLKGKYDDRTAKSGGKLVVKALGKKLKKKLSLRRGKAKAKVRLPELTEAGRFKVRVTFKGKRFKKRTVTKHLTVAQASWVVPDAAMRAQIRAALDLPEDHALTLDDAADLNNTNGAALWFGDVRTAAGLEVATNLSVLDDFTAGNAQDSRGLDNIVRVNGDFWISNAVQDASYPKLAYVGEDVEAFNIDTERIRSIAMPELVDAKSVKISNRPQLASLALPKLTTVRTDVSIVGNPALATLDLPALANVGGRLRIDDLETASAVRLPSLTDVLTLTVSSVPRAVTFDLSGLTTVRDGLHIDTLPQVRALVAPKLQTVGGGITVYGLGSITQLRMPALQSSHGRVLFGIGEDFPILPTDGSAVSFGAFDVTQAVDFDFAVRGLADSQGATPLERWSEFLTHFGVVS